MLRAKLGRGATSIVWRATHEVLAKDYAIKFLDLKATAGSSSTASEVAERFRFEAQVSCRLGTDAENIVRVHDAGVFRDRPYMVMDLVRGESVQARLKRGPMEVAEIRQLLRDVAAALSACHREGFAHRDTKPANILRCEATNRYKLADFGLVKCFGEAPRSFFIPRDTVGAMLVGTPAYMCPEAISADKTTSGLGDVWALAVTLHECLLRALPFVGDGWPAVAVAIMKRNFKRPSEYGAEFARFDALFEKAFAKDAGDRFQTPSELVGAFDIATVSVEEAEIDAVSAAGVGRTMEGDLANRLPSMTDHQLPQTFSFDSSLPPLKRRLPRHLLLCAVVAVVATVVVLARPGGESPSSRLQLREMVATFALALHASGSPAGGSPVATAHPRATVAPTHLEPLRARPARPLSSASPARPSAKPFDQSEVW